MKDVTMAREHFGAHVMLTSKGPVAWLTIDRPPLNLLTSALLTEVRAALARLSACPDRRVLILSGGGEKAFVAGVDVHEMAAFDPESARRFIALLHASMADLRRLPIPVIARIDGFALGGGCEMAMACDLRIASKRAQFGMPEVRLGIPSVIEAALMPGLIGTTRAMELLLTGRMIDAHTAQHWGLINHVAPAEGLNAAVDEVVQELLQCGPKALAAQKRLVYQWMDSTMGRSFRLGIDAFSRAYTSEEPREGMRAFSEKRRPHWAAE
jgi:enoyl-CoA hydratase